MLLTLLSVWAGLFYLLNKIFFACSERYLLKSRTWRIYSWTTYIIGLPAWATIFILERNWIAAALEIGGLPSMIMGLTIAVYGKGRKSRLWDVISIGAIIVGLSYSIYDFNGINNVTQFLELGIVTGFLLGTYLLAKEKSSGYLFFMFMNVVTASLMVVEGNMVLVIQQAFSFMIVLYAYVVHLRMRRGSVLFVTSDGPITILTADKACLPFGFLHGDIIYTQDNARGRIMGVAPDNSGDNMLWCLINRPGHMGYTSRLEKVRDPKKAGWKKI